MSRPKKLFFILLIVLPLSVQGKIFALFVGVSEYEQPVGDLTFCHRDAIAMYGLMKEHTPLQQMKLLVNRQARLDTVVYWTKKLFLQAQPQDIVLFFFSGHGKNNLFCMHDQNLSFSTLQKICKECRAKRKLIFADACYSGTLRQEGNQATPLGTNVLLFLSSRSNQNSIEDLSLKNGMFTYFLIAGLRGGADQNRDRRITAVELFDFVNRKVRERSNGRQIPVMWGNFDAQMVILQLTSNQNLNYEYEQVHLL